LPLILLSAALFSACNSSYIETITYSINEPVMMSAADFRSSVKVTSEKRKIENYGKICFYNGYLYIAENGKGIHIIDNRNPEIPVVAGFIELQGNYDMSVRNNTLYADMFTSLIWFDISNPQQPATAGSLANAFPTALPAIDNEYSYDYGQVYSAQQRSDSVIVGWKLVKRTENIEHQRRWLFDNNVYETMTDDAGANGVTGSMSRFTIYSGYLYAVIGNEMEIFDLQSDTPKKVFGDYLPYMSEVETIFSYKDKMFLGMPSGMAIYSVKDPASPTFCSLIVHAYGCDPVVVENDLAYVTVRSDNFCGQSINELFVVDVSNEKEPKMLVSYSMTHPKGLGIDNGILFVCDDGLKIFKADNPQTIMANQLAHYKDMDGYDVIPFEKTLMMIADDGIYQYDYSNLDNIRQISKLAFER
jgi:hypothetical protein